MLLVVGGTGTVGRELVGQLAAGGHGFRVLVRDREAATKLLDADPVLVQGDLREPAGLVRALDGVKTAFLLSAGSPEQVALQGNLVKAAIDAGVERIVKLSTFRPEDARNGIVGRWHAQTEREIRDSGLAYTFLQPNFFMQNFLNYSAGVREAGVLDIPVWSEGKVSFIDVRDVAAAALVALTEDGHEGRTYSLTGSQVLTLSQVAATVGIAIGRPVVHRSASAADARPGMIAYGMPEWLTDYLLSLYAGFEAGLGDVVSEDLPKLIGRAPITITQFAADFATAFGRRS